MKKQINKIIGIFSIITIITYNIIVINAAESCPIEETPEYIDKYIENVHKVIENTNKLVSERYEAPKNMTEYQRMKHKLKTISILQGSFNRIFSWSGHETDVEFTAQANTSEIPNQVIRDVNLLQKESVRLKLAKPEGANIEVTGAEICKGVENCNFNPSQKYRAIEVVELLKKSTNQIKNIIQNQATDYNFRTKNDVYLLNPDQLLVEYSRENLKKCDLSESYGDKGFFATIVERIKKINLLNNHSRDGMASWKEAVDLLYGKKGTGEKEREVLARELQRQGIGGNNASAIMSNLDAFNNSKPGEFPFLQGKEGFLNSLQLQINEFEEALENKFPGYKNGNPQNKEISAKEIPDEIKKLRKIENSNIDIKTEYNRLKSLSVDENIYDDQLLNKMIDIHLSISSMINTLNKACPIAVKVCNDQKKGQGDCGKCF